MCVICAPPARAVVFGCVLCRMFGVHTLFDRPVGHVCMRAHVLARVVVQRLAYTSKNNRADAYSGHVWIVLGSHRLQAGLEQLLRQGRCPGKKTKHTSSRTSRTYGVGTVDLKTMLNFLTRVGRLRALLYYVEIASGSRWSSTHCSTVVDVMTIIFRDPICCLRPRDPIVTRYVGDTHNAHPGK